MVKDHKADERCKGKLCNDVFCDPNFEENYTKIKADDAREMLSAVYGKTGLNIVCWDIVSPDQEDPLKHYERGFTKEEWEKHNS